MYKSILPAAWLGLILVAAIVSLTSCRSDSYRDISEFDLQPDALKDGARIRLLGYFYGPSTSEKDFYNHVVARSEESGDTVNILIPWEHGFTQSDGDSVYNYFSPDNLVNKVNMEALSFETREIRPEDTSARFPEYRKVVRLKEFDYIAVNKFPTVKGTIGTIR